MMNSLILALFIFAYIVGAAQSQEYPGCFMVTKEGGVVQLPGLCPPVSPVLEPLSTLDREEATLGTTAVFADRYCELRARGQTHRQASENATLVVADYMFFNGIEDTLIDLEWYKAAIAAAELLCKTNE